MKEAKFELFKSESKKQPFGTHLKGINGKLIGGAEIFGTKQNAWKNILSNCTALKTPGIKVVDISMPDGIDVSWFVTYNPKTKTVTKKLIK